MNQSSRFQPLLLSTFAFIALAGLSSSNAHASMIGPVNMGTSTNYTLLALTGGIDDSGPTGPQANPWTVDGPVGIASSGQKFSASGSVKYSGPIYLHSGDTFNSSAPGVPQPTFGFDSALEQAKADAFAASNFASSLAATATFGAINNTFSISKSSVGDYVFNISSITLAGGQDLTLSAPTGSNFILNISGGLTLSGGSSIVLAGGLTPDHVLINYTGTSAIHTSGGGNGSQIYATILAPFAEVGLHPGFGAGSIIAASITMSSGADVVPVPEPVPSTALLGFVGFVVAFGSRRALLARARAAVSATRS